MAWMLAKLQVVWFAVLGVDDLLLDLVCLDLVCLDLVCLDVVCCMDGNKSKGFWSFYNFSCPELVVIVMHGNDIHYSELIMMRIMMRKSRPLNGIIFIKFPILETVNGWFL